MTTLAQARDDINKALGDAVSQYNTDNSSGIPILAEDVLTRQDGRPDSQFPHFRGPYIKHSLGDDQTLGPTGGRLFSRAGVFIIQVMTPVGDGFTQSDILATLARNAYEGVSTPNGVWFRKLVAKEVGVTGGFYQVNVTGTFEYTEQR